ncbi:MAG: 5-(carboxyamino)imidazole ribonucleotide mutase [Thermogutta sp.]
MQSNHDKGDAGAMQPVVGILMGSDSDWQHVKPAVSVLREFSVPFEIHVMSAHRTPAQVAEYAAEAESRGLRVVLAAAGGAAHLAGVVAAHTVLPVIGIPIPTGLAGGLDSLLSMVQMPGDIPVATVGVGTGGARNAGLLAVAILALTDAALAERLKRFRQELAEKVASRDQNLQRKLAEEIEGKTETTG